jgi:hypothetical protein
LSCASSLGMQPMTNREHLSGRRSSDLGTGALRAGSV